MIDKDKGGKAEYITSSFSQEKIDWKNIVTQNDYKEKVNHQKLESESEFLNLAVIFYEKDICNEYFGLERGRPEDFSGRDLNVIFTLGFEKTEDNNQYKEKNSNEINEYILREINVNYQNPFKNDNDDPEERIIKKKCPGSPIYYKGFYSGGYVVAIINKNFDFNYFDRDSLIFLSK